LNAPHLIVITDLDGTLLDAETYRYDAALPGIQRLRTSRIPLIFCSSKTRSEIDRLGREMGLAAPFICENGAAVCWPSAYFPFDIPAARARGDFQMIVLGTDVALLRRALNESSMGLDLRLRSFGAMNAREVARLTGLPAAQAALALQREYDEPFVVEGKDQNRLFDALQRRGLKITYGGRLFHITGGHDKGRAVGLLQKLYRRLDPATYSVGLGNSQNDLPLLRAVDRPILVRNLDGSYDTEVLDALPQIERTVEPGPAGWNTAITEVLDDPGLPPG
jgi:mannosyl-3-phosphoglycerate phosphatase